MALVKANDLRQHSAEELLTRVKALRKEHFELEQKNAIGQLDRPHRLKQIRLEIAKCLTVVKEKEKKS